MTCQVRDSIMPLFGHSVVIPKPYNQLCTKHVLVCGERSITTIMIIIIIIIMPEGPSYLMHNRALVTVFSVD